MVYFAPAATTKNGLGKEIKVPNDFSKGVALKMNEKNHVKRFEWDFHLIPPADGVVGIATETE